MNNSLKKTIGRLLVSVLLAVFIYVVVVDNNERSLRDSETYQTLETNWPKLSLKEKDTICTYYDQPELSRAIVGEVFNSQRGIDAAQLFLEDTCGSY